MAETIPNGRIVGARPGPGRVVHLVHADGTQRTVDVAHLLNGPVFERIREDAGAFGELYFDAELGTICWPNGADIAPETLAALPATR